MNTKELRISCELIPDVAPAIIRLPNGKHHNGILYRNADGKVFITHFAWDSDLRNDEYQGNYYYADMKITKSEAKWIAAFVGEVARADDNARIPYMIVDDPDMIFDSNGKWRPVDDFSGSGPTDGTPNGIAFATHCPAMGYNQSNGHRHDSWATTTFLD